MKWLLLVVPLLVVFYTCTYGSWALKKGFKRGGIGTFFLAAFVLALSIYALFLRNSF